MSSSRSSRYIEYVSFHYLTLLGVEYRVQKHKGPARERREVVEVHKSLSSQGTPQRAVEQSNKLDNSTTHQIKS